MTEKDPHLHIDYIIESVGFVAEYVAPGKEYFLQDRKTYDAVLRRLSTLAESTTFIPAAAKSAMPQIDWAAIGGFRNVMVHEYLGSIDNDRVWDVIQNRLPTLKTALEAYLKNKKES
jgi:uncharacterized protein with HEPN domain